MSAEPPAFPKALDDDDDDVAWALQTALVQWERGGHADAVVWLRRAAQAAVESGEFGRAADLERGARAVEGWIERGAVGPAPDEDDGVDALLASDAPAIEAVRLEAPTQSLIDAIEAEAHDAQHFSEPLDDTDIEDLPDVQDVEDIEAIDVDFIDDGRGAAEPEPAPEPVERERPRFDSDAPDMATLRPPEGQPFKLPPPPIPRLPLPEPRSSKPPSGGATADEEPRPSSRRGRPQLRIVAPEPPPQSSEPPTSPALGLPPSSPHGDAPDPDLVTSKIDLPPLFGMPAPAAVASEPPPAPPSVPPEIDKPSVAPPASLGIEPALLEACRGLEDLPTETQKELAAKARVESLGPDQEVSDFGLALVTRGSVLVMPTIAEGVCGRAREGEPIFSQGNLSEGVSLRAVAELKGAEVAVWQPEDFAHLLETCPWVAEELRAVADRYQALAGSAMGPLGERLDDGMRAMVTERAEVRYLAPGETVIEQGEAVPGLFVVGGGHMELVRDGVVSGELTVGDLLFASAVLSHDQAPATVRASAHGALLLVVDRMATHELLVSVPPLLELLATS